MPPTTEKPTENPTEETTSEPAAQIPSCIKKDGNVSNDLMNLAAEYYYKIPEKVRTSFEKNN